VYTHHLNCSKEIYDTAGIKSLISVQYKKTTVSQFLTVLIGL